MTAGRVCSQSREHEHWNRGRILKEKHFVRAFLSKLPVNPRVPCKYGGRESVRIFFFFEKMRRSQMDGGNQRCGPGIKEVLGKERIVLRWWSDGEQGAWKEISKFKDWWDWLEEQMEELRWRKTGRNEKRDNSICISIGSRGKRWKV